MKLVAFGLMEFAKLFLLLKLEKSNIYPKIKNKKLQKKKRIFQLEILFSSRSTLRFRMKDDDFR